MISMGLEKSNNPKLIIHACNPRLWLMYISPLYLKKDAIKVIMSF